MSTRRRVMQCSPEDVFDVLADGWLYTNWVVGAARVRAVDPGWPHPGARIHHSVGLWPLMTNDTTHSEECDPPRRLLLQARAWPSGEATVDLRIEPHPDGAEVWLSEQISTGPGIVIPQVVQNAALRFRNDECLARLALLAEGRSAG